MQIELFYFDGCPNHEAAFDVVSEALDSLGLKADVKRVRVVDNQDAAAKRFLGSPSVRVDGHDLEIQDEAEADYTMKCRRYRAGGTIIGYPSRELVIAALRRALDSPGKVR